MIQAFIDTYVDPFLDRLAWCGTMLTLAIIALASPAVVKAVMIAWSYDTLRKDRELHPRMRRTIEAVLEKEDEETETQTTDA